MRRDVRVVEGAAWKLIPSARADAHQVAPTHSRSRTSLNNDLLQRVPVGDGWWPRCFGGYVTQVRHMGDARLRRRAPDAYERVPLDSNRTGVLTEVDSTQCVCAERRPR